MRVLVAGGAGYIGSHTVVALAEAGHEPVIADNFANSSPAVLDRLATILDTEVRCHELDLCDLAATEELFAAGGFDAVIHFAGLKAVGESVAQPLRYYANNLACTFSLLSAMRAHDVKRIVFSSSATVYGLNGTVPMREDAPVGAIDPYGRTKVMIEQMLADVAAADPGLQVALLRYFNPVGAHPSGLIGEDPHGTPNNLMPFLTQVAVGRQPLLRIFGDDYPTPDGTCLRDYIHVDDLAAGHLAALAHLAEVGDADTETPGSVGIWNLGTGRGTSVFDLVAAFERALGRELPKQVVGRRPGDLAASYADVSKATAELKWQATRDVDQMCQDSVRWQQTNPTGYAS